MLSQSELIVRSPVVKVLRSQPFTLRKCRQTSDPASDKPVTVNNKNSEERLKKLLENIKLKRVPLGSVIQDANTQINSQRVTGNEKFVNHARAHARKEALDAAKAFKENGNKLKSIQNDLTELCEIAFGSRNIETEKEGKSVSGDLASVPEVFESAGNEAAVFEASDDLISVPKTDDVRIDVENNFAGGIAKGFDGFSLVDLLSDRKLQPEKMRKSESNKDGKSGRTSVKKHSRRVGPFDGENTLAKTNQNLYGTVRLNIFDKKAMKLRNDASTPLNSWDVLLYNDVEEIFQPVVRNGFDSMIKLTREKKLWTFPIDNEQGFEEEENVPFHNHIFLERYCEDFPKHPRIQKFMKVVCLGLSKNHKLTFAKKISHIEALRQFFDERFDLLKNSADFEDEQNIV